MMAFGEISNWLLGLGPWRFILSSGIILVLGSIYCFYLVRCFKSQPQLQVRDRKSSSQPEDLLSDLADAVLGIDSDDKILYASERAAELFGFSEESMLGRNYQDFLILPENFNERSIEEVISNGKAIGFQHGAWGLKEDGSRKAVQVTVTPSRHRRFNALISIREVDPRTAHLPSLDSAVMPAELLTSAKRVRKFATLLAQSSDLSDIDREFVLALEKSSDNMYAQLNYQQCIESIEDRRKTLEKQPLQLGKWLSQLGNQYRELADRHGASLSLLVSETSRLVGIVDQQVLEDLFAALFDFSICEFQSPMLTLHLTHDVSALRTDNLPVPVRKQFEQVAGGHERCVSILFFANAAEDPLAFPVDEDSSLVDRVKADPRIQTAWALAPLLDACFSVEANAEDGLLFQLSLTCQSFGVSQPALTGPTTVAPKAMPIGASDAPEKERTVLSVTEGDDLKTWIREKLTAKGFKVTECLPQNAIEKVRNGDPVDLVVFEPNLSREPDFDLTFEMRQYRDEDELPILLVHQDDSSHEHLSFYSAQAVINFPVENELFAEKISQFSRDRDPEKLSG
ncbi:MAG: PAS domain S-box protein [Puniceicoccaceae bacterium]